MEIANIGILDQNCLKYFEKKKFDYIKLLEELVKRLRDTAQQDLFSIRKDPVDSKKNDAKSNLTLNSFWCEHEAKSTPKLIESS